MPKILSKAGDSLADIYDVKGSIAGIENLESRDLSLVHELGATVFSERFSTRVLRAVTGNLSADDTFDLVLTAASGAEAPPGIPARLLGVTVLTDAANRMQTVMIAVREPVSGREVPVWAWESTGSIVVRIRENDGTAGNMDLLLGDFIFQMPVFVGGAEQPTFTSEIAMRGLAQGFGAGTVDVFFLLYIGVADPGVVPSSRGLPIPSW